MTDPSHTPGINPAADPSGFWNTRYAQSDWLFGREPNAFLCRQAPNLPRQGRALCVADGEGRNGIFLAQHGLQVTSFDLSAVAVDKARTWMAEAGVSIDLHVCSDDDFPWGEGDYDVVAAIFVQFAPPAARARMFRHIWTSLKPGGVLLIQGYTPKQLGYRTGGPDNIEHLYTPDILRQHFPEASWALMREYDDDLAEGSAHRGRSALIEAVALKPLGRL
jgi:SAM-dependent methyltransferase